MAKPEFPIHTEIVPQIGMAANVRIREDVAFASHKAKVHNGQRRRAEKLIAKLQLPLQRFLQPDEVVFHVARMQAPVNLLDQFTFGILIYSVTTIVVVATNKRLLRFRTTRSGNWDNGFRACAWSDIRDVEVKGWVGKIMWVHYKDGTKEKYWGLRRFDALAMKKTISALLQESAAEIGPSGKMHSFCPECAAVLTAGVYECAHCKLLFKNERAMRWLALVPGGAYFYCKRIGLGILDLLGESYLLLLAFLFLTVAILTIGAPPADNEDVTGYEAWVMVGIIGFALMLEVAITIHHCNRLVRDFIPAGRKAEGGAAAAAGAR
jgi:hypothetical protein